MEEVIEPITATHSPQESAIRFLLRHAQCQRALTIKVENACAQLAAETRALDTATTRQAAAGTRPPVAAVVEDGTPARPVAPEGSFLGRFSQAYAAARHLPLPRRGSETGSRRSAGSSAPRSTESASAVA
ncbi:hypothetical protein ACFPPA_17060 [Rhodanobacter ginsengisoli]|uniref:Uncharacterized protein n=1 Tax=Rhodanobacter ginsengisoli TaxID=418646 RepID=A0ABW0QTK1_9GAMM